MTEGIVLDAGALIAIERRSPHIQALLTRFRAAGKPVVVPTVVVAQVVRGGGRQAMLRRFLADSYVSYSAFDYTTALRVGALLGASGTSDVVDAAVVALSIDMRFSPVVTSDPGDLHKIRPDLPLIVL